MRNRDQAKAVFEPKTHAPRLQAGLRSAYLPSRRCGLCSLAHCTMEPALNVTNSRLSSRESRGISFFDMVGIRFLRGGQNSRPAKRTGAAKRRIEGAEV